MKNDVKQLKDVKDLQYLYYRYKDAKAFTLGVIVLIFLASFVLVGKVIIPQMQNWISIRQEVAAAKERIKNLRTNQNYLVSVSDMTMNDQFTTANAALPFEKDFIGILNAVAAASIKSGVLLDDYSFQVGNLSTKSAQLSPQTAISVNLTVNGNIDAVKLFMKEMRETVPLSEVVAARYVTGTASIDMIFYYKIAQDKLSITYTDPITIVNGDDLQLLTKLEQWRVSSLGSMDSVPVSASDSGIPVDPF